jgi:hypothetical protein
MVKSDFNFLQDGWEHGWMRIKADFLLLKLVLLKSL